MNTTLSTHAGTVAARKRSASKISGARRPAVRVSMVGMGCALCGLDVDWSARESDGTLPTGKGGARVARRDAHSAHFGHVLAEALGGKASPANVAPMHRACNRAAGDRDLRSMVIWDNVPLTWVSDRAAADYGDVRDVEPFPAHKITDGDMARARAARGLPF